VQGCAGAYWAVQRSVPRPLPNSLQLSLYGSLFDDPCLSETELTVSLCTHQWSYGYIHLKFGSRFTLQPFYP